MKIKRFIEDLLFEQKTKKSRIFDVFLIIAIVFSVLVVILESVQSLFLQYKLWFVGAEIIFTIIFSIEYLLRVWVSPLKRKYILSFYGIIDLLAIIPLYIAFIIPGTQVLFTLRILRFFRIFRTLKMLQFLDQEQYLIVGLKRSFPKISIFIFAISLISIIIGSIMYAVESSTSGFDNIPLAIYWTVVTLTTVGYGDIVPLTAIGKFIATILMVLGYGIIAVPTGLITVDLYHAHSEHHAKQKKKQRKKFKKLLTPKKLQD